MSRNLRVHIAPVGFDFRRVTVPLIQMQADKVYLVTYSPDDNAKKFFGQVKKELAQNYEHIQVQEVFLDVWNLFDCLEKFRQIILKEKGNHIYINVSTGTKITGIAGMLSCMLWGASPYYARVSYPSAKETEIPPTEYVEEPDILPVYEIKKPGHEILLVLSLLKANGGRMKKARLIEKLESLEIIRIRDETKTELSSAAKHSQLRAILDPMENEWGYVEVKASGRRSEVFLTEKGGTALQIFGVEV